MDICYAIPVISSSYKNRSRLLTMPSNFSFVALRLTFCLFASLFSVAIIDGQELAKNTVKTAADSTEPTVNERVRVLEAELEKQNAKLDQLQKTIADQQTAIQALLNKLSGAKAAAADENLSATSAAASTPEAAPTPQPPTVEQRVSKLEGQAVRIGPLRVSGDFRLRYDGIFRSATDPTDPPVTHSQNSRARYRLRINFDTDLYPTLS